MRARPSVLMLLTNTVTYDARVNREASTLARDGYDLTILGIQEPGHAPDERHPDGYRIRRLSLWTKRLRKNKAVLFLKWLEYSLRALVHGVRTRPRVLHAHDIYALPAGYFVSALAGAKLVYDSHELWSGVVDLPLLPFWMFLERRMIRRCAGVISANAPRAALMAERYPGIPPIVVLNNYPQPFPVGPERPLEKVVDRSRKRILLYQGVIRSERGLEILVESSRAWSDRWVVVIIGYTQEPEYLAWLHAEIARAGVTDKFLFLGAVKPKDLPAYIASADVGHLYYRNDCLNTAYCAPNKLYDYLNLGVPVLCNDLPGLKMVSEQKLGVLFGDQIGEDALDAAAGLKVEGRRWYWTEEEGKLLELYRPLGRPGAA